MRKRRVRDVQGLGCLMRMEREKGLKKQAWDVLSGKDWDVEFEDFLNGEFSLVDWRDLMRVVEPTKFRQY